MEHVFVGGATGYLGRFIVQALLERGLRVTALARSEAAAGELRAWGAEVCIAQATEAGSLAGSMGGVDTVISALGITRQRDGLTYDDVDFGANRNLLAEAEAAGVSRFAYVSVLGGPELLGVEMVRAKERFVELLQGRADEGAIAALIVRPSGFFSDMRDILAMAGGGRVWLFGDGGQRLNPIHGADLAAGILDALDAGEASVELGGPEVLTVRQIGELAFAALGTRPRFSSLPMWTVGAAEWVLPRFTPRHVYGPAQLFLAASRMPMVGACVGVHHLADFFAEEVQRAPELRAL